MSFLNVESGDLLRNRWNAVLAHKALVLILDDVARLATRRKIYLRWLDLLFVDLAC
jgi:hypothetical protein